MSSLGGISILRAFGSCSAANNGKWDLAFLLTLLEKPAPTCWAETSCCKRPPPSFFSAGVSEPCLGNVGLCKRSGPPRGGKMCAASPDHHQEGRGLSRARAEGPPTSLPSAPEARVNELLDLPCPRRSARAGVSRGPAKPPPPVKSLAGPEARVSVLPDLPGPCRSARSGVSRGPAKLSPHGASKPNSCAKPAGQAPCEAGRTGVPDKADAPISFRSWALRAHLKFIKARTPFSSFLSRTLHLSRRGVSTPASVVFPLPLPFPGCFRHSPSLGSRARARLAERRLLHVVVMCLNYLYQDCSFVPLELLQREPNKPQLRCLVASRRA